MADSYIRSLIESVRLVFSTMVHTEVDFGKAFVRGDIERDKVVATIQLSGDLAGVVILSSGISTAEAIVERFAGVACKSSNPDFNDAIGELANLVAGTAKSKFYTGRITMSVPSVSIDKPISLASIDESVCICVPCSTDIGMFWVDLAVRGAGAGARLAG